MVLVQISWFAQVLLQCERTNGDGEGASFEGITIAEEVERLGRGEGAGGKISMGGAAAGGK